MKKILNLLPFMFLLISCSENKKGYHEEDEMFILLTDSISPDKKHRIVEYQFDHGAHGYSRVFWAIAPTSKEKVNLRDYNLPDGYKSKGWTIGNEAVLEKWEPYYYKEEEVLLKSGDQYKGVTLQLR
ncbi:hypothetical protein [Rufibacter tibetensis]|uniref:Uncharacterized protein n=1 Tax=Rufibacter tibetensis TaxID=512763 RepID=A0A0P0C6T4_9BACT|nr:hypothetical protein [Rufibacter tibetensis]ALJ00731.1 hypothetical protein DC20_19290 [Rufibacter tibetensis]